MSCSVSGLICIDVVQARFFISGREMTRHDKFSARSQREESSFERTA